MLIDMDLWNSLFSDFSVWNDMKVIPFLLPNTAYRTLSPDFHFQNFLEGGMSISLHC